MYKSDKWRHKLSRVCLSGMLCLTLICMGTIVIGTPSAYAGGVPGGNISDPVVRAVDIAKPAVVRIITQMAGLLTVNFSNGQNVTFPLTLQNGFNGYPVAVSGTGAFISAHGDILTADHVVHPVQDDRTAVDQALDQLASQDVSDYINHHLNPAQPTTPDQVAQELISGQLRSTSQYQQQQSFAYLSTDYSGPLSVTNFQDIPPSQYALVDQIEKFSPFNDQDIAIIHVSGMDNMPMLQLGNSSDVQEQDTLTIIGFPGNGDVAGTTATDLLSSSINQVLVSSIKTTNTGSQVIQVGGNVEQGDSGGPALDSNGQVVGIVSFGAADTAGSTSFLRTSNSAQQLIQAAGISTAPSAFQQAWSKAFNDYASNVPGHWHQSMREFQQLANTYPNFKAVQPFLQYASQQAQTEKQTQEANSPTSNNTPATSRSGFGSLNPMYIIIGGVVVLIVLVGSGLAISRRRKPALAALPPTPAGYSAALPNPAAASQAFPYQAPSAYPPPNYGARAGQAPQPAGYPPQSALPSTPQPGNPSPQQMLGSGMSAFGAPPVPVTPRPASAAPAPQWRTWACGHVNRDDARFCRVCGEPAPPTPIVRRVEQ
jgi:S1-C subfamily serine protease